MRETTGMIENKDTESFNGRVGMYTRASTKRMREMVTAKCTGRTEVVTKENGFEEFSMAMEK